MFELEIISSYDMILIYISVYRNKLVVLVCKELIGVFNWKLLDVSCV